MISEMILNATGQSWMIGVYIAGLATVSLIAVVLVPKSVEGRDLADDEAALTPGTSETVVTAKV
jgi:hypothetical protein